MTAPHVSAPESVWRGRYAAVTIGSVALVFLAALQSLAVTTVMPVVSAELDGAALYAVAFAGTLATSVIGMVAAGAWADRSSPVKALTAAVAFFVIGLLIAGAATSMPMLVAGRLVQGLGAGAQTVSLYVIVARVYPSGMHGRVFAAFSAAWVIPSLIGPFVAGAVTEYLHWRWVFLGVAALAIAAFVMVYLRLSGRDLHTSDPAMGGTAKRILLAVIVAASALGLSLSGELGSWAGAGVVVSVTAMVLAIRPLLPRRTLLAGRGLPSVVLTRSLIAGAMFGTEIYIPYLLIDEYDFSATWAGLALTTGALTWAVAAELQGRFGDRLGNMRITVIGLTQLFAAIAFTAATAAFDLHPAVLIVGWALSGSGMGLMYPRLTVLTLAYSTPQNQGFNTSALSISDAVGSASIVAVMGVVFTMLAGTGAGFTTVFVMAAVLAILALLPGLRLGHAAESGR